MCLSANISFAAAAVLLPAGGLSTYRAYRVDPRYLGLAMLPALFGVQQLLEGLVWTAGAAGETHEIVQYSLAYMFFAWLVWPVWVPISTYFLESGRRRALYLAFAVAGGMIGALQYVPYFAHDGWLVTTFLENAIRYEGTELLDLVTSREVTYSIYLSAIIAPLLLSSDPEVKVFGLLVAGVLGVTYAFFAFAYISVFCFGGAVMSIYLVFMIFRKPTAGIPEPSAAR
ncbi:DUF6629 family protein [Pseudorhizobium flavum]|uniref:Uncharacterized protein n=1 Tax=Pseudorhizobium flavum TaxID=1335061 RepID=A0A7X0DGU1_9HYPH|nr:DUF6629 family protein [Pseudorhizobium flavum]MBB6182524.1 hypothetical protein [Pseudorhizobium flavum]CAD6630861.1 hypothetical protein RFYW14_04392 [Pseudorhizobium flavum]